MDEPFQNLTNSPSSKNVVDKIENENSEKCKSSDSEADESFCNPEPPEELIKEHSDLIKADTIGDTVFSKHWLFTTLMKLIQEIDKLDSSSSQNEDISNIEEELQDELCELWDMAANSDVIHFLLEFQAIDILSGVIAKSRAPRATEICVGILGNMACDQEACRVISTNSSLVEIMLLILDNPDAPTLIETTRLITVCLSNSSAVNFWINAMKNDAMLLTRLVFILESSSNTDLLKSAANLVDKCLDLDDSLCVSWCTAELVHGVCEAFKEFRSQNEDYYDIFLHILQLLSTCEAGVEALVVHGEVVQQDLLNHLTRQCSHDEEGRIEGHEPGLASAISVLSVLIHSWPNGIKILNSDYDFIRCLLKILENVYPKLHKQFTPFSFPQTSIGAKSNASWSSRIINCPPTNKTPQMVNDKTPNISIDSVKSPSDPQNCFDSTPNKKSDTPTKEAIKICNFNVELTEMLYNTIKTSLKDTIIKLSQKIKLTEDVDEYANVPDSLNYLNTDCSENRIYLLVLVLKETPISTCDCINHINQLCTFYKLDRLNKLIAESSARHCKS